MDFNWNEWLNIALRWFHVFAGILWIGQTYFFTWLDGRFTELLEGSGKDSPDKNVWMVHSGGFYVVEKQTVPRLLTQNLHWFKWEAAFTWLSGMSLLVLVYYSGGLLADAAFDETKAILLSLALLIVTWFLYDVLWNSSLAKSEPVAVAISFVLSALGIFAYTLFLGGRTAYIHAGAMFGTIMAANVWVRILPAQRQMVAALKRGDQPDLALAARAKMRSKHNTFMVIPVVFIMISNHYPVATYGADLNWLILTLLVLVGWITAHFLRRA